MDGRLDARARARSTPGPGFGLTLILAALASFGCKDDAPTGAQAVELHFMHTFQGSEAGVLGESLARFESRESMSVEQTPVPFHLAKNAIDKELAREHCVDLVRIDATWLPGWSAQDRLRVVPDALLGERDWLPAARALGTMDGQTYGLPQIIDGLALVYRKAAFEGIESPWPAKDAGQLVATMAELAKGGTPRLGLRDAGYWFVPFLRAWGGDLPDPETGCVNIDTPASLAALERFAGLFGSVAPVPAPRGEESVHETRAFQEGELAAIVTGPWAVAELTGGDTSGVGVAPLPGAPLGGHLYVVPRCARHPSEAWKLAGFLTSARVQAEWAKQLGQIPTAMDSLDSAGRFVGEFFHALKHARPLPRHPMTSSLFDDLDPALRNLVGGHATASEIQNVLTEAWSKRLSERGITPRRGCDR